MSFDENDKVRTPRWLTEHEQAIWRDILRFQGELNTVISRQIQSETGLSNQDFQVLVILSEAPERGMRTTKLADALIWERSRLSHQVTRMEKRGLVSRATDPADGRVCMVSITERGMKMIESAAPGHVEVVRQSLFDVLSSEELELLGGIYHKLLKELHKNNPTLPCSLPGPGQLD